MNLVLKAMALVSIFLVFPLFAQSNVAKGKTVTVSSVQTGNAAANAVDSVATTRWCASAATVPQWLMVDLGASYNIVRTEVMWQNTGVYKYKVETSSDNVTYTQKVDRTANTLSQQTFVDAFTNTARYVRITATTLPSGAWASIFEFRVLGTSANVAPAITTQPVNATVTAGAVATFSLVATGTPAPTYQWRKNGSNITSATSSTYTTPVTTTVDNGAVFSCVVTNAAGSVTSSNATLTVNLASPVITVQPQPQVVTETNTALFSITATGTSLTYQWRKNAVNISGATSITYVTPVTAVSDNGTLYSCVVSNAGGSITSNNALLTVNYAAPTITQQAAPQSVIVGATATFTISAACLSGTLTYQWRKNSANISGANSNSYTTPPTSLADNGALFSCYITNPPGGGNVSSNSVTLTVTSAPVAPAFTTQPIAQSVTVGSTATFSVAVSGNPTPTYQWRKNGTNIAGATSLTYTTPVTTLSDNGALFSCVATNSQGTATSSNASLTVTVTPLVYVYPNACGATQNMKVDGSVKIISGDLTVVNGKINVKGWSIEEAPDYVFEKDYKLKSLSDVESYVKEHKHLTEVPSATDMNKNGVDVTSMNMALLKKIEELTLYSIEQNKKIQAQNERIEALEKKIKN